MSTITSIPTPLPKADEVANCATHAIGLLLSVVGTAALLALTARHGDPMQMAGVVVYGVSLVALYTASTLSHSFEQPRIRHFFRTLDQVCIFLLIAGTFTPISLTFFRQGWWWVLFIGMWSLALVGILVKIFFTRLHNVAVSAYVLLGWLPVIAIKPILQVVPATALVWILAGGIFYTLGTIFLARDTRVPFFHAVWHLFVIAGSACHYWAVMSLIGT